MGFELDEAARREICALYLEEVAGFEEESVHEPLGEVDLAFFCSEFEDAGVGGLLFGAVDELEDHGIGDMEAGELVEGGGGEKDFAAVVEGGSVRAWHHGHGVAAVVFVEAAGRSTCSTEHGVLEHGVVIVLVAHEGGHLGRKLNLWLQYNKDMVNAFVDGCIEVVP